MDNTARKIQQGPPTVEAPYHAKERCKNAPRALTAILYGLGLMLTIGAVGAYETGLPMPWWALAASAACFIAAKKIWMMV